MMSHSERNKIVETATMVVCGYAFIRMEDGNVRIVGLGYPNHALVMRPDGEILETSMDDVEMEIVGEYWERNRKYMEDSVYAEVL